MNRVTRILILAAGALTVADATRAQPVGPTGNLPLPPAQLIQRLRHDDFEIASVKGAGAGVTGARKIELLFRNDKTRLAVKWKRGPEGGDGWNNAPRREIGAYAVQRLFLDPDDYTVPPVTARCLPFDTDRAIDPQPSANIDGTQCVFGVLSVWLANVKEPQVVLDGERFSRDRAYAYALANLNLLTYLIAHRDARDGNILISTDATRSQLFAIDNGIAFGGVLYNFFTWHFDRIRVGGLPKKSIDRLRRLTRSDLDALGVLEELETDSTGVLRQVTPTANFDPEKGVRLVPGRIQFGLTAAEIDALAARLKTLLVRIDKGELSLF